MIHISLSTTELILFHVVQVYHFLKTLFGLLSLFLDSSWKLIYLVESN